MEWKLINKKTQEDSLGNLLQADGGVVPKTCQQCKSSLIAPAELKEIKQTIPYFECEDCDYETSDGGHALWHEHDNNSHVIKFTTSEKVIDINRIIEQPSKIIKSEDDVIILCFKCYDKKY